MSKEDLDKVWSSMRKGSNIILWCNGLKKKTISEAKIYLVIARKTTKMFKCQSRGKGRGQRK